MKVLISSFAFAPEAASEPGAGWEFARAAAANHEVWVATAADNRAAVEGYQRDHPELWPNLHMVYHDQVSRGPEQLRYLRWQQTLAPRARALHARVGFEVSHHVTLALDWLPTGLERLQSVPFVWGPVGGVPSLPWHLARWLGPRGVTREALHAAITGIGRRVAGRRTAGRASVVIGANRGFERAFSGLVDLRIETNSAIDLAALPARRAPHDGPRRAIFAGRLLPWKGLSLAIAALARPTAAEWSLVVLGDGPDAARNQRLAESLGVAQRVEFRGFVARTEVLERLAEADALLLPTLHDAGPWVVAEAVSIGCPAVCLDWGGPATLLEHGGGRLVSTRGDVPGNLARALAELPHGSGEASTRFDRNRLGALVDEWYSAAVRGAKVGGRGEGTAGTKSDTSGSDGSTHGPTT